MSKKTEPRVHECALPEEARKQLKIWRALTDKEEQASTLARIPIKRLYFHQLTLGIYPASARVAFRMVHLGMITLDSLSTWYAKDDDHEHD
jgi:hypothetical protein